jgi:serine/threonine protein kinase
MDPGTRIGKYVIDARLGAGGNGTVYVARDEVLGRRVALKMLHAHLVHDARVAARFRQEAQAMAQLNHPNVVIVHDFFGEANLWAIVMELVEHGETLGSVVARQGKLEVGRAIGIARMVASGLGHAHARGIVHRDVKPSNVLVIAERDREIAKLTDFGIARIIGGEHRTDAQTTIGSLRYIAPEQARSSHVDARADVYSLGATLYEALTGRTLFPYDNAAEMIAAQVSETPTPPTRWAPEIPRSLEALVLRTLSKDPGDRPAHGDALATMLGELERSARAPSVAATRVAPGVADTIVSVAGGLGIPIPDTQRPPPRAAGAPSGQGPRPARRPSPGPESGASIARAPIAQGPPPHFPSSPRAPAPAPAPSSAFGPTTRAAAAPSDRAGLWIGIGAIALIAMACLVGSLLCVITGVIR